MAWCWLLHPRASTSIKLSIPITVLLAVLVVGQLSNTAQWPKHAFDNANTGRCPWHLAVLHHPHQLWSFSTRKSGFGGSVLGTPAISAQGDVIFGAQDKVLYCLDSSGEPKWGFAASYLSASPTITKDGSVLIGDNKNQFYSLNGTTGLLNWSFTTGSEVNSAPVVTEAGDIIIASYDQKVYCLAASGALRWSFLTTGPILSSAALSPDGTNIVIGNKAGMLYSLALDGSLRWNYTLGGRVFSPAFDDDGSIAVTAGKSLYYFSSAGELRWKYAAKGDMAAGPSIAHDGSVIFEINDYLGMTSGDHRIVSHSRSGVLQWSYSTGTSTGSVVRGPSSSATITGDGFVLYGGFDDHVHCLDGSTGRAVWNWTATSYVIAAPILTADGFVLVADQAGTITLLGNSPTASPTPAPSSRPSLHPTLFPSAAPFQVPPPAALITINDGEILGASCAASLALAVAIVLLRGGLSLACLAPVTRLLSLIVGGTASSTTRGSSSGTNPLPKIIKFGTFEILVPVTLTLAAAASNVLQISHFLAAGSSHPNQQMFAWAMIAGRACVVLQALVLLARALSHESYTRHLASVYLHSPLVWLLICFVTLFDISHVRFLPWRHSPFADRSRGFPTPGLFKYSLLSSSLNSLLQLSLSVARGLTTASLSSFLLSLASFFFALATAALRLQAERLHDREARAEEGGAGAGGKEVDRLPELELSSLPGHPAAAEEETGGQSLCFDGSAPGARASVQLPSTLNPLAHPPHSAPHDTIPDRTEA